MSAEKLSLAEKKAVKAAIERARGTDKKGKSAQSSIPYQMLRPGGICQVTPTHFTKTIQFRDINYQLSDNEDKQTIFDSWCDFLNYFDSSVRFQLSFLNLTASEDAFVDSIQIPDQGDEFDSIRQEYAQMLQNQLARGNNGLMKTKYLTFGIDADSIKTANKYLIAPDGVIQKGHQVAYIRALALDLADETKKPRVIEQLKQELKAANYHLNTGFLSTVYLLPTLCDNGLVEEAFQLLEQTEAPGWLHPITIGATTIPENWNGFDAFRDSLNHYSLGAVCQFLFEYVAGIRPTFDAPGFKEFELKPVPGGSLTWAEGEYKTKYGKISSGWKMENKTFLYHCTVPEKTTAHLCLPDGSRHTLGAGSYQFTIEEVTHGKL